MSTRARAKPQRDRHQEIVEAAAQVITDRGLAETRIQDIADRCGVSPGLILYYFGSKDRLLVEALTYANDQSYLRMSRELRKMPAASERMDRLIQLSVPGLLPEYSLLDEWALWLEIWVRALRDPQMAKERETLDRRWVQSISEVIRYGRQTGEFPSDAADADVALVNTCGFVEAAKKDKNVARGFLETDMTRALGRAVIATHDLGKAQSLR